MLGGNSILAIARRDSMQPQSGSQRREALETGIFPLLGMDNTSQQRDLIQVSPPGPSLPDDQETIQLFNTYRHRVHPSQFVLDDLNEVERVVCSLIGRDSTQEQNDSHFLCLLHAILAAGAQFSDLTPSARVKKSQKHRERNRSSLFCPIANLRSKTRIKLSWRVSIPLESFQEVASGSCHSWPRIAKRHEPTGCLGPWWDYYQACAFFGASPACFDSRWLPTLRCRGTTPAVRPASFYLFLVLDSDFISKSGNCMAGCPPLLSLRSTAGIL